MNHGRQSSKSFCGLHRPPLRRSGLASRRALPPGGEWRAGLLQPGLARLCRISAACAPLVHGGAFDVRLRAPGRTRPEAKSAIVQAGTDCAVEAKRQPSPGLGPGRRTHPRRPGSRISMRRREGSGSLNAAGPATCRSSAIRLRFPLCLSAERSCRPCGRASGSIPFPRHRA